MRERLKVLLIMFLVTAAAVVYAFMPGQLTVDGYSLRKLDISILHATMAEVQKNTAPTKAPAVKDSVKPAAPQTGFVNGVDTTHQVVLFFGDSMTNGISLRLDDYCHANGHTLYCVTWNSSTTKKYSESNILDTYIRLYHPTFFIVCLGSNELFVHDVASREQYVRGVIAKFGGKPFVWVSPPNWKQDTGMDSLIRRCVGDKRFFDSSQLTLERGDDHIHPTMKGAEKWTDLIAEWLGDPMRTEHPIRMTRPGKPYYSEYYDIYSPDFHNFINGDSPERHRHYNR